MMALSDEVKLIVNGDVIDNIIDLTVQRLEEQWNIANISPFELAFAVNSTIEKVKNVINQQKIPEGLTYTVVDLVCAEFLQKRVDTGSLPEFDVGQAIKTLKIGDTSTTFADTGKSGIELLISSLNREGDLLSYRKLKW